MAETVDPNDRLCGGRGAFGASVTGTPAPVEMCLPDDANGSAAEVKTTYTADDERYIIVASVDKDGVNHEITISFVVQVNIPQEMSITATKAHALADANGAWFYYRENGRGSNYEYVSSLVQGDFTVTLSGDNIAVGTFRDLEIDLVDAVTGADAGKRMISEGFFAVTPDP